MPGPFTDDQIKQIAETWSMVNSHGFMINPSNPAGGMMKLWAGPDCEKDAQGRTNIERIKAINPGFLFSNYRHGSNIEQNCPNEAAEVETRFPLAISIWNTSTTLTKGISAQDSTILISRYPKIPKGAPAFYPFKKSTTQAEHTKDKNEYVAWIRLGDEILRVDDLKASDEGIEMQVKRGIWGTAASAHPAGETVFQSVYIGRSNIGSLLEGGDAALSGTPDTRAPQMGIRYALMMFDPKYIEWLAEKAKAIFDQNYDICWLDIATSNYYNNADAYGGSVEPWNLQKKKVLTPDEYREWQQIKQDGLYKIFPNKKFWINNVKPGSYFNNGHERYQLSGENGHHPVDGGCMEMYVGGAQARAEKGWRISAAATQDWVQNNFGGVAWSKGADFNNYRLFSYATYLMAYEPGAKLKFCISEATGLLSKPQSMFYLDLGKPLQHFKSIDEAKMAGQNGLYARDFEYAKLFMNVGVSEIGPIALGKEYIDIQTGQRISALSIPKGQAKLLALPQE